MPWLFDANHMEHWADDRSAQDFLPRLVRQLIHGLTDDLQRIVFPAGSSVQLGGWDGIVESPRSNEFVPPGVSGWELSTQKKDKKGKADEDYEKRSDEPGSLAPAESTFVFVTPRRWAGKSDWEKARKKEGVWRDVRVLDAEDLVAWLERTPPVAAWFAAQLGHPVEIVRALSDFWASFKEATQPALSAELFLAGRKKQRTILSQWQATILGSKALGRTPAAA